MTKEQEKYIMQGHSFAVSVGDRWSCYYCDKHIKPMYNITDCVNCPLNKDFFKFD